MVLCPALELNSQLQTVQILAIDVQVLILRISYTTVSEPAWNELDTLHCLLRQFCLKIQIRRPWSYQSLLGLRSWFKDTTETNISSSWMSNFVMLLAVCIKILIYCRIGTLNLQSSIEGLLPSQALHTQSELFLNFYYGNCVDLFCKVGKT